VTFDDDNEHRWANTVLIRAVGAEPELGFEAADVLARAHRNRAQRRARLAGALTIVALATIGVVVGRDRAADGSGHPRRFAGHEHGHQRA
jgi:hypothetical protein